MPIPSNPRPASRELIQANGWTFGSSERLLPDFHHKNLNLSISGEGGQVFQSIGFELVDLAIQSVHPTHHRLRALIPAVPDSPMAQLLLLQQTQATSAILYYPLIDEDRAEAEHQACLANMNQLQAIIGWTPPTQTYWADDESTWFYFGDVLETLERRYGSFDSISLMWDQIISAHPTLNEELLTVELTTFLRTYWSSPLPTLMSDLALYAWDKEDLQPHHRNFIVGVVNGIPFQLLLLQYQKATQNRH